MKCPGKGPRGWVHQPWAHPSSPSLALPVPGPLEHLSAYARRAVPIHSPATTLDVRIVSRAGWGLAARPWLSSGTLLMPCFLLEKDPSASPRARGRDQAPALTPPLSGPLAQEPKALLVRLHRAHFWLSSPSPPCHQRSGNSQWHGEWVACPCGTPPLQALLGPRCPS